MDVDEVDGEEDRHKEVFNEMGNCRWLLSITGLENRSLKSFVGDGFMLALVMVICEDSDWLNLNWALASICIMSQLDFDGDVRVLEMSFS